MYLQPSENSVQSSSQCPDGISSKILQDTLYDIWRRSQKAAFFAVFPYCDFIHP